MTRWSATPATPRGHRAAAAAICRSRPTAKTERHHYEGGETRNYATYNPQVARDDMFLLGHRETAAGGKIAPFRSSSALVLSSTNANREHIYVQQPPISASGYSSPGVQPALSAYRAQGRDQDLRRLPSVGEQRQQRHHGAVADVRHQLREFRRLPRLCRRRRAKSMRCG